DHDAVVQRRVALATDAGGRIGPAKRHMLVDGNVVADLRTFADYAEAMVEEEPLPDLRARMNVDGGQEPSEMIDKPREEKKLTFPEPVGNPMETQRRNARIKQHVPPRSRGGVA